MSTLRRTIAGLLRAGSAGPRRAGAAKRSSREGTRRPRHTGRSGEPGSYAPQQDGQPDPGEVVWGWVPYEEDASRGKDRPVLLIGRRGERWLALMLTSKDHDRDAADEARHGRHWMDVGTGAWDRERRPSEVRLDRLIELAPDAIRREGAALARSTYDAVIAAARELHTFE